MIASSTTSPIASTRASSVSRLIVYPKTNMMKKAPMSDSGMAIVGMTTERKEARKRKITSVTMTSASTSVWLTSRIELFTYFVAS